MKRILLTLTVSAVFSSLFAQTGNNPFAKLGYKKHIMYTSSKGEFEEFHDMDDVVEIGSALFNTKTNQIVGFIDEQQEETEVASATAAMSIDPLCEKYYWITPYAFCSNNPIRFVDPDGREVVISGALSDEALRQLQARAGTSITLSRNAESGKISYTANTKKELTGNAKLMAGMIDNSSITVNLQTTDSKKASTGQQLVGGAFMGNKVTTDANGNKTVEAFQEINPNFLGAVDEYIGTSGKMIMHEATEAYEGAKISQETGESSKNSNSISSVYPQAHKQATKQHEIFARYYDKDGNIIYPKLGLGAAKVEYYVLKNGVEKIIQTNP